MKSLHRLICLVLFGVLMLMVASGCNSNVDRPRITQEPVVDHTQPPLPEDYDTNSAEIKSQEGNIKFLTSDAFSSSRAKGEVSEAFKAQYAEFAIRMLKECAAGKTAMVSPLSILTALQMTANGAQGETLDEMMKVLGGNIDRDTMNQQLFNYYESLRSSDDAKFHVANAVWFTDNSVFTIKKGFVDVVENTFRAQLAKVPFADPATVDAINKWCSDNTDEMIPKVLDYDAVGKETVMVLANALCFDALWLRPYEDYQVSEQTFHGANGDSTVKTMKSKESCYIEGPNETGFVKRYCGGYSFVALLPDSGVSIDDYLASLSGGEFVKLMNSLSYDYDVNAGLPEFTFDWDDSLVDVLKKMGMNAAFDGGKADFSALGEFSGNGRLYISNVIHKTHIEVNQSGTKAAAVTAVVVDGNAMPVEREQKTVILDRPFVYAIVDTESMLPIFIGAVTDIG